MCTRFRVSHYVLYSVVADVLIQKARKVQYKILEKPVDPETMLAIAGRLLSANI